MSNNKFDNEYFKKTLALFCEGIIQLDNNLRCEKYTIPVSLEKSLDIIKSTCIMSGVEFDSSLKGVYNMISKPVNQWGLPFLEDAIEDEELADIIIYNKRYKLMSDYKEHGILTGAIKLKQALSADDIEEYFELSKPFYKLREELTQEDYEIFRTFMQGESLLDSNEIEDLLFDISDSKQIKFIKDKFIVPLDKSLIYDGAVHNCVNCGFPMRKNSLGELSCNFKKCVEKKKISGINLNASIEVKINNKKEYFTFSNYAQKYMKIPGIAEKELREMLKKLELKYKSFNSIEVFPRKDTVDFKVIINDTSREVFHLLDVKDYLSPNNLAKIIAREYGAITSKIEALSENSTNSNLEKQFLIIVPDYLLVKDKDYKKKFKNTLKEVVGKNNIELYSISKYIEVLKKTLKDFDKEIKAQEEKNIVQINLFD